MGRLTTQCTTIRQTKKAASHNSAEVKSQSTWHNCPPTIQQNAHGPHRKLIVTVTQAGEIHAVDDCLAISTIASKRHLRPAGTESLSVPRTRTTVGTWSFAIASPVIWNSLPTALRSATLSPSTFAWHLKAHPLVRQTDSVTEDYLWRAL